jgi:hypothetical protein
MLRFHTTLRFVVFLLAISLAVPAAAGKKGRGRKHPPKKSTPEVHHQDYRQQTGTSFSEHYSAKRNSQMRTGSAKRTVADRRDPWSTQRQNEGRKLNHRLDTADHLDRLADRNGNPRLHDTAERMRQKAFEHYDKRMAKIDSKDPLVSTELPETSALIEESLSSPTSAAATEPWAAQLAEGRQELLRRLDASQEVFKLAEQSGNEELRTAASRIEQQALQQFYERLDGLYPSSVESLTAGEAKSVLVRSMTGP